MHHGQEISEASRARDRRRFRGVQEKKQVCPCGKVFTYVRHYGRTRKYCSEGCRVRRFDKVLYQCKACGKKFDDAFEVVSCWRGHECLTIQKMLDGIRTAAELFRKGAQAQAQAIFREVGDLAHGYA